MREIFLEFNSKTWMLQVYTEGHGSAVSFSKITVQSTFSKSNFFYLYQMILFEKSKRFKRGESCKHAEDGT